MKNLFKIMLVGAGFTLATMASSGVAQASSGETSIGDEISKPGGCVGTGYCGTTSQGTRLNGHWVE